MVWRFIEQSEWLVPAFWAYLLLSNVVGFVTACADKRRARLKKWRIPERRFLLLAAVGGGAGVLLGFLLFRHKTRHGRLLFGVAALAVSFYGAVIAARFL